jgi:hypothetical protein
VKVKQSRFYLTIHTWVRRHLERPAVCPKCGKAKPQLCNTTGNYDRDFNNWEWLCQKCHYSKYHSGENSWNYDKPKSLESKLKNRLAYLGRKHSALTRIKMKGRTVWNAGKTGVYSPETLAKMSKPRKGMVSK